MYKAKSAYITKLSNVTYHILMSDIRQGELNFSQIAEAVGFESIHYFSSVCKKQTGMTPTEYARSKK